MDSDILTFISFVVLLLVINLLIKNKKKNWVTWTGVILTSLIGAGFISGFFSGTILSKGIDYFIAMILIIALGIYLILKVPKNKKLNNFK